MRRATWLLLLLLALPVTAAEISIRKLEGSIVLDGDLSDAGWTSAARVEEFFEYSRSDNAAPPVHTTAYLGYDDRYLYVAFQCDDPRPAAIRAPFVDRDQVLDDQDYVGIALDTQNERRSSVVFRVNPRGVQADLVRTDATETEDFAPDFFFESSAKMTTKGWVAEMRIPLSSLRFPAKDVQEWAVILVRNYPRDFRYVMASTRIPKGSNCYICHADTLAGLANLPRGGHITVAPYSTAARDEQFSGTPLATQSLNSETGFDMKWSASPKLTLDATLNPDFSQIESDVPQVSVNSRVALSYPEKRTFFLEGVDLFSTPFNAVYTRSITAPAWGIRTTGMFGSTAYTVLAVEDRGGGSVVIPGRYGSSTVPQDFRSTVAIGRLLHAIGDSSAGLLISDREVNGGGYNRVIGPDFVWMITKADKLRGQYLYSSTENPDRPDLSPLFDGSSATGHAARIVYARNTSHYDIFSHVIDYSPHFRNDNGYMPWADLRGTYFEYGQHLYPKRGFASYIRPFFGIGYESAWRGGGFGFYFEGKFGTSGWIEYHPAERDGVSSGGWLGPYQFTEVHLKAAPTRWLPAMTLDGSIGERGDYVNSRVGNGASYTFTASVRPTVHFEAAASFNQEWLDVQGSRLYSANVNRVKGTYIFNERSLARVIVQKSNASRSTELYQSPVTPRDGDLSLSALYGYRLNWQTTAYIGYGDYRLLDDTNRLMPTSRSLFAKVSYAFQR